MSGRVSIVTADGRIVGLPPHDLRAQTLRAAAERLLSRDRPTAAEGPQGPSQGIAGCADDPGEAYRQREADQ
jgi:hypothetical protein